MVYERSASVSAFLKDIGSLKPLTEKREQELAVFINNQIESLNALKKLVKKSAENLTRQERDNLIKLGGENPALNLAVTELVEANLYFGVSEAFKFIGCSFPHDELISLANEGLVIAAIKFKPNMGAKFMSYAVYWIRQTILKALAERQVVRPPINLVDSASRLANSDELLTQALGRHPTKREVEDELNIDDEEYARLRAFQQGQISLDIKTSDTNEVARRDTVEDTGLKPDEATERVEQSFLLNEIMEKYLTERERLVIKLQFGLLDLGMPLDKKVRREMRYGKFVTLQEVGERLGITRERVRQITEIAMKKLRAGFKRRNLDLASLI